MASRCIKMLQNITVEPVLVFTFLSMHILQVVQQVGLYKVVCQQTYASIPEIDCDHLSNIRIRGVPAENLVQQKVTMWNMALGLSYIVPGLVADIFLGALGDRYGRKANMLLGMTGMMISIYPLILLFTYPKRVPIYVLVIMHAISGITGYTSIVMISSFAYLADTVLDASGLTVRMSIMSVIMNAASIVGPFIAGSTARSLTQAQTILVCEILLTCGFFYCMCRMRQMPPAQLRRMLKEKREKEGAKLMNGENVEMNGRPGNPPEKLKPGPHRRNVPTVPETSTDQSIFTVVIGLLKETWATYSKPREGHVRLYLLCSSFIFFLFVVSELGIRANIFTLYVQKAPLSWNQDTIGYFKSAQAAVLLCGTTFGVLIFKKWLRFTDTFIILISTASHIGEVLIFAFASQTWIMFAAAGAGVFSSLAMPCLQSFIAKHVGAEEVGKAYTVFGMATNVGFLISSAIYSPIYYATLSFFPGFVFIFATMILGLAFLVVAWLNYDDRFKCQSTQLSFKNRLYRSIFDDDDECTVLPKGTTIKVAPAEVENSPGTLETRQGDETLP